MRRYENHSTIMTSNRPLEEWRKLLSDVPTAGAILDRFLHHATQVVIRGRSYRIKDSLSASLPEEKSERQVEGTVDQRGRELVLAAVPGSFIRQANPLIQQP